MSPAQDATMTELPAPSRERPNRTIRIFGKSFQLPQSRPVRIVIGFVLIILGLLGFLPVLGFWMIPLGLVVLSVDFPFLRRWGRALKAWVQGLWHTIRGHHPAG